MLWEQLSGDVSAPWCLAAGGAESPPFDQVLIVALGATGVVMLAHLVVSKLAVPWPKSERGWRLWERLLYVALLGCVGVLAWTSFSALLAGSELRGWPLMIHMVGAGGFVVVLPLGAVTWADASRVLAPRRQPRRFGRLTSAAFWLLLVSGAISTLSMLASMLPLFGTESLRQLVVVHRYSGIVVVMVVLLHVYGLLIGMRRR
jgi:hypothetical protein